MSAGLAQPRPSIVKKIRFQGPAQGLLGSQRNSHISPRGLKSLGHAQWIQWALAKAGELLQHSYSSTLER